jgi:hypothetical protein
MILGLDLGLELHVHSRYLPSLQPNTRCWRAFAKLGTGYDSSFSIFQCDSRSSLAAH